MTRPHAPSPDPSDQALCRRIALGRQPAARDALAALYARHAAGLFAFLTRRSPDLAEDLLQETFLVLARRAHQFEGASACPWLFAIAKSRLARAGRRASREVERLGDLRQLRADAVAPPPAPTDALSAALARLPARTALVLELRFAQDLSHAEVAAVLGVSLRTAKARAAAALEALRAAIERDA